MIAHIDTRERILDIAQLLLEQRGFNAFSYQDIANELGIKKASLHYHFPSKADLGAALAERHVARARAYLADVRTQGLSHPEQFDAFVVPFQHLATTCQRMCAGGMIAAEFSTLDTATQEHIRAFFSTAHQWLSTLLDEGRQSGAFTFDGAPEVRADVILAALEGMILLARIRQTPDFIDPMIKDLKASLGG